MKPGCAYSLAIAVIGFVLLSFVGNPWPTTCLSLADHNAPAKSIRDAATSDGNGGAELCEGLALLAERKGEPASGRLAAALAAAPPHERWSVQGYYARALAMADKRYQAMRNFDEAIEAGAKAGNVDRENIFRADRALVLARSKQYAPALKDLETVYGRTSFDEVRAAVAYEALKIAVASDSLPQAARWFPLAFDATREVGDVTKLAYATEFYGQMLDDHGDFTASAAVYQKGLDATDGWGGDPYLHAELLEFAGQSRFAAGDFAGGEQVYGEAAEGFRRAGEAEYGAYVDKNLRARQLRHKIDSDLEPGAYEPVARP